MLADLHSVLVYCCKGIWLVKKAWKNWPGKRKLEAAELTVVGGCSRRSVSQRCRVW